MDDIEREIREEDERSPKTWEDYFRKGWECGDGSITEEEEIFKRIVETFEREKMKPYFEKVLRVVNDELKKMSMVEFARFKMGMSRFEWRVGEKQIFTWTIAPFGMGVLDSVMGDDPIKYHSVQMWLENFWGLSQYGWSDRNSPLLPTAFYWREDCHPDRPNCIILECPMCGRRDCPHDYPYHYDKRGCLACKSRK